eukprot:12429884-Karenia_brevis.AAC.2
MDDYADADDDDDDSDAWWERGRGGQKVPKFGSCGQKPSSQSGLLYLPTVMPPKPTTCGGLWKF